jgi:hypothetical protein
MPTIESLPKPAPGYVYCDVCHWLGEAGTMIQIPAIGWMCRDRRLASDYPCLANINQSRPYLMVWS